MGADSNEKGRKPRAKGGSGAGSANPFKARATETRSIELSSVPGVLGAIEAVLAGGRALMLSRTSDGGAMAVHVLDNGQRYKQYASSQEELNDVFSDLYDAYGTVETDS